MALVPNGRTRNVRVAEPARTQIRSFLQGAVYAHIRANPQVPFAAFDLVGNTSFDWQWTPLIELYSAHIRRGKSSRKAVKAAGIDLGWLLKSVLRDDQRRFRVTSKQGKLGAVRAYQLI